MQILIKNMVCSRCIMVVRQEFEKAGVNPLEVNMGEVILSKPISDNQLKQIDKRLTELGFEILDDKNKKFIERAKTILKKSANRRNRRTL